MKKLNILILLPLFVFGTLASGWSIAKAETKSPGTMYQLSGAYEGYVKGSKENDLSYLLIYPVKEEGQLSGRVNVLLITGNRTVGQIFEAYRIDDFQMALLPVGLDPSGEYISPLPVDQPVAVLSLRNAEKGLRLEISPTSTGDAIGLQPYYFDRESSELSLGPSIPNGYYRDGGYWENNPENSVNASGSNSVQVLNVEAKTLGLSGVFRGTHERKNLIILRSQDFTPSANQFPSPKIKAFAVPIIADRGESLVLGLPTFNGKFSRIVILKKRN